MSLIFDSFLLSNYCSFVFCNSNFYPWYWKLFQVMIAVFSFCCIYYFRCQYTLRYLRCQDQRTLIWNPAYCMYKYVVSPCSLHNSLTVTHSDWLISNLTNMIVFDYFVKRQRFVRFKTPSSRRLGYQTVLNWVNRTYCILLCNPIESKCVLGRFEKAHFSPLLETK